MFFKSPSTTDVLPSALCILLHRPYPCPRSPSLLVLWHEHSGSANVVKNRSSFATKRRRGVSRSGQIPQLIVEVPCRSVFLPQSLNARKPVNSSIRPPERHQISAATTNSQHSSSSHYHISRHPSHNHTNNVEDSSFPCFCSGPTYPRGPGLIGEFEGARDVTHRHAIRGRASAESRPPTLSAGPPPSR